MILNTFVLLSTTLVLSVNAASINLDFSDLAQPFEGIGALSGGGGVTRLLIDYEENLQQDIYDILFEPKKGASLQFIKVEIGGDTQRCVVIFGTPVRRGVVDPNFQKSILSFATCFRHLLSEVATLIRILFSSLTFRSRYSHPQLVFVTLTPRERKSFLDLNLLSNTPY